MMRLASLLLALLVGGAPAPADDFAWLGSLEEARARARAENKPVLAIFRCTP